MVEKDKVLEESRRIGGKVETMPRVRLSDMEELSTYYTPGVAYPCLEIKEKKELVFEYTGRSNTIAIVSDGTRILGLGNIGPEAGLPVMEGKAVLYKRFGGVDAVPICIGTTDEEGILGFLKNIEPTFGAINIEDIESPKAFRIVKRAQETSGIPIFHDDQQGTSVVTLAALINAAKIAGKGKTAKIVINGAGTAGLGVAGLVLHSGFKNVVVLDSRGALYEGRKESMNEFKEEIAKQTNADGEEGGLEKMAEGADVLIGLSKKGVFTAEIIRGMNRSPVVFALANPEPEIRYDEAKAAGAFIAATGRSDAPNQVNNVVAFPGIMRGLLDVRAKGINMEMLYSAAVALAEGAEKKMGTEYIIQGVFDEGYIDTAANVAAAVAAAAAKTGMARVSVSPDEVRNAFKERVERYLALEKKVFG